MAKDSAAVSALPVDGASAPASVCAAFALLRVGLSQFRSYDAAEILCDRRPVVLVGENGAGKTNVLEAISYLSPGRGLRGAAFGEACREANGQIFPAWSVSARVEGPEGTFDVGTGLVASGDEATQRRVVRINGAPAAGAAALTEILRVLWLTPAMDRLFIEGAAGRRRFLDRIAMGFLSRHAMHCASYERAMRERLRLLRDGRGEPRWLDGLEAEMARHGAEMIAARFETIARLMEEIQPTGSAFPRALVLLAGEAETLFARDPVAAPAVLAETFFARRRVDAASGRTTFGPHRCDLEVRHAARNRAAASCSTGEQKALLIGLTLAAARAQAKGMHGSALGGAPVLLLDEVAAHLDEIRREALFDEIAALGVQAWMTGTDHLTFSPLGTRAQAFCVSGGMISHFALDQNG